MFVPSLEPPPCGGRNSPSARVEAVGTARCGARPTSALPRRCGGLQLRHTAVALFYRGGGFLFVGAGLAQASLSWHFVPIHLPHTPPHLAPLVKGGCHEVTGGIHFS